MRLLVTGASGLLGLNLALEAGSEHAVTGVVNAHRLNGAPFPVLAADLSRQGEVERVLETAAPDALIHCAALANLEACEADPARARAVNADLPARLAEACARRGVALVHVSTDAVFDGVRGGYTEADLPHPLSVYAQTKLEGEQRVAALYPAAIIARVNFYGWSLNGERSLAEVFFNNLSAGRAMPGFTDVVFCPLLVNHLARLLVEMAASRLEGLYHVVSGECLSKYDFGVALARQFGLDADLIHPVPVAEGGLRAQRSPDLRLSSARLARALGRPLPGLADGLRGFYDLYCQGYPARLRALAASS